ncbi:Nuclear receptor 2C2-associated protein, partial [Podila epigama]
VSSVLNRDHAQYGKQNMIDDDWETCWNSDHGTPQFVIIDFGRKVVIETVELMFQGGFAGNPCLLQAWSEKGMFVTMTKVYPDDINQSQFFTIPEADRKETSRMKIVFEKSTDFFGRVTVYKLEILGQDAVPKIGQI